MSQYAQYQASEYQSAVDRNNAQLARQQAAAVRQAGVQEAGSIEAAGRAAGDKALAQAAGSGMDITSGSPGNLFAASAEEAAGAAARTRTGAEYQAWALRNEAQDLEYGAKARRRSSILGGIGSGLGQAAQIGVSGYQMYKATR